MQLPVLNTSPRSRPDLAAELRRVARGEVRFSPHDRALYSTDASLYQVEPLGVVTPLDADDAAEIVAWCGAHSVPLLPRGGGTSLAGQSTNRAVILDLSPHLRRILHIDAANRRCTVEPGITVDDLNRELTARNTGLFFAPDPATTAQAAIGGCIGNNAAGARSIRYGRTSENLAALDVALTSGRGGERLTLAPGAGANNPAALRLAQGVADITRRHATLIRERFPKTIRRNAGYGLDLILHQLDRAGGGVAPPDLDLTGLLCGSEGTLAVTLAATLKLHPLPKARALAVISFTTLEHAIAAVNPILSIGADHGLTALELLDDVVLDAARNNIEYRAYVDLLPGANTATAGAGEPKAVLYVEFSAFEDPKLELAAAFADLRRLIASTPGVLGGVATYTDAAAMLKAWKLRKAGEPLLHGLPGRRKPVTFVEDNAVPVERLAEFVARFKTIVGRHATRAAYWAHASVGVLHVRPMIDLHDDADRTRMRDIAVEVADLAKELGGVMSGEHGDGRVRGPLLERFFGPELMRAFREVKALFDPKGLLNPGNIIGAGDIPSITENLRTLKVIEAQSHAPAPLTDLKTYFSYDDQHEGGGLTGAAEQCNGAGLCRKTSGGTMCPSFRATLDERHSTRGRANALRHAITGQIAGGAGPTWDDPDTIATLDLCLSCKACKSECPSNVDISRLKAEYTAQRYRQQGGAPLAAQLFGHVRALNRLGSLTAPIANFANALPVAKWLAEKFLGISRRRTLPRFERSLYAQWGHAAPTDSTSPRVLLFADCFTAYNEPKIGLAARNVLNLLGYHVDLGPAQGSLADGLGGRGFAQGCCGRALISTGLLDDAIDTADRTLELLQPAIDDPRVEAILFAEPSCLSAIKDDWLQLNLRTPLAVRKRLAAKARLVEDFIAERIEALPAEQRGRMWVANHPVTLHAHCHQKALWGAETSARALRAAGFDVTTLDSGCCGMAGAFGYMKNKLDLSNAIGELSVFPPVRAAPPSALIAAPGTSCRHQIRDATGREALHPIEILARQRGPELPRSSRRRT